METLKINDTIYSKKIILWKRILIRKIENTNERSAERNFLSTQKVNERMPKSNLTNVSSVLITDYGRMMAKSLILYSTNSYPKPN